MTAMEVDAPTAATGRMPDLRYGVVLLIVATGILVSWTSGHWNHKQIHDFAGWGMIVFAAALFWLLLEYMSLLFCEEQEADIAALVREART